MTIRRLRVSGLPVPAFRKGKAPGAGSVLEPESAVVTNLFSEGFGDLAGARA
jgi:hypothetical protein